MLPLRESPTKSVKLEAYNVRPLLFYDEMLLQNDHFLNQNALIRFFSFLQQLILPLVSDRLDSSPTCWFWVP